MRELLSTQLDILVKNSAGFTGINYGLVLSLHLSQTPYISKRSPVTVNLAEATIPAVISRAV